VSIGPRRASPPSYVWRSVSPSYAPPGKALVSVSLVGTYSDRSDEDLQAAVETELRDWFGKETATWRHLKTYRIPFAQVSMLSVKSETNSEAES
jgi:hypothetical protein